MFSTAFVVPFFENRLRGGQESTNVGFRLHLAPVLQHLQLTSHFGSDLILDSDLLVSQRHRQEKQIHGDLTATSLEMSHVRGKS